MTRASQGSETVQQLLDLHRFDQRILEKEHELKQCRSELTGLSENIAGLEDDIQHAEKELKNYRVEARTAEGAVTDEREHLDQLRTRLNNVKNQRQYGAATIEYDQAKQKLRNLEDEALGKLQSAEDVEERLKRLQTELEEAREQAGPRKEELEAQIDELEDEIAIQRDKRENLAIRLDDQARQLYDRIRAGRSEVVLAPLTDEGVCGQCFTAVPAQQQLEIRGLSQLHTCEGCGVILYPEELDS